MINSGGLAAKKLKKANNVTGVNLSGEPIKKVKKAKDPRGHRPPSP